MNVGPPSVPADAVYGDAVAFRIYDLDRTGDIQPGEVARLLTALLQNNPDIALDEHSIQKIVEQVSGALPTLLPHEILIISALAAVGRTVALVLASSHARLTSGTVNQLQS